MASLLDRIRPVEAVNEPEPPQAALMSSIVQVPPMTQSEISATQQKIQKEINLLTDQYRHSRRRPPPEEMYKPLIERGFLKVIRRPRQPPILKILSLRD